MADALHKEAGPGGPQLRPVVVGAHVQVEAARVLPRVEPERLLAEHLHKAQRIHPAQVGVRSASPSRASRPSERDPPARRAQLDPAAGSSPAAIRYREEIDSRLRSERPRFREGGRLLFAGHDVAADVSFRCSNEPQLIVADLCEGTRKL